MTEKMHGIIEEISLDAATFHSETFQPTYINCIPVFLPCRSW